MDLFNNYTLSNKEIEKILTTLGPVIKKASKINNTINEDCEQTIMIVIYKKLSKNKKF